MVELPDLPDADVLLVVPPLAHLTWPSVGAHQLQACAREAGFELRILYMNVLFAREIGALPYAALCNAPTEWLLGDRLFREAAWGLPPLGDDAEAFLAQVAARPTPDQPATRYLDQLSDATGQLWEGSGQVYEPGLLRRAAATATELTTSLGQAIAARGYAWVGASTTFDQTAASVAILRHCQGSRTLLGGANCEGAMAGGLAAVAPWIDHFFAGESEGSLVEVLRGERTERIVAGQPVRNMDALPTPDLSDWTKQIAAIDLAGAPLWLSFETSRGCWWGEKRHCTFCGLNGEGMGFREKSAERVIEQLTGLLEDAPTRLVSMTDNIMPFRYHRTLVPQLPEKLPGVHIFYEQKANLSLEQVRNLAAGGIKVIQPGLESLSTPVLKRMRKGVMARQNVATLRYARTVGMGIKWNLLYAFPGDDVADYAAMLPLLERIHHLNPPHAVVHLQIDRFSPYFDAPEEHGLSAITPLPAYAAVFPPGAPVADIAYHFTADWQSGSREDAVLMGRIHEVVTRWQGAWQDGSPPVLHVSAAGPGQYVLTDTRKGSDVYYLTRPQAQAVLVGGPWDAVPQADWAVRSGFAISLDGWCCPLATAPAALLAELEAGQAVLPQAAMRLTL